MEVERRQLEEGRKGLGVERRQLGEERKRLGKERRHLQEERKRLGVERRQLEEEKKRLGEERRQLEEERKRLGEERRQLEEERKQLGEVRRQLEKEKRLNKFVTKGNNLINVASLLTQHRQNCPERLLPAGNELNKLLAEYVVAIVGTTLSTVGGAAATSVLAVAAPFTFGITGVIAAGTGAATVAIAAGGGVGAEKVRDRMRNVTEAQTRAQDWISTDKELCSKMIRGVDEYEESLGNMREMFGDDTSMHAYMKSEGVAWPSEVQRRFTQLSTKVVKKWRAQKFDPDNDVTMAHGRQKAKEAIQQFLYFPSRQQDFSTITLFLNYTTIKDLLLEYAKQNKESPHVQELVQQIVSDLEIDRKHIQPFAELKSLR